MLPNSKTQSQCEHLYVLTLALIDATQRAETSEIHDLLQERGSVLDEIVSENLDQACYSWLTKVKLAEERLAQIFSGQKEHVLGQLIYSAQLRKGTNAYLGKGSELEIFNSHESYG